MTNDERVAFLEEMFPWLKLASTAVDPQIITEQLVNTYYILKTLPAPPMKFCYHDEGSMIWIGEEDA